MKLVLPSDDKFEGGEIELTKLNLFSGMPYRLELVEKVVEKESLLGNLPGVWINENPEVGMHASQSSSLAYKLSDTFNDRIKSICVFTQSEHVLNGIRRSVLDDRIDYKDVSIFHIWNDGTTEKEIIIQPKIYTDGGIDRWPRGFFDQLERDLDVLIDGKKSRNKSP